MTKIVRTIFDLIDELQRKERTGWIDHKISPAETVWTHSREVRQLSRNLAKRYLHPSKAEICGKFGAIHDIVEGIAFDVTPHMGISATQKRELEMMAIDYIGQLSSGGKKIRDLWVEYDAQECPEARFVHLIDKLHVVFTALRYELDNRSPYSLQPFWDSVKRHVNDTPLIEVFNSLASQRPAFEPPKPILERKPHPPETFERLKHALLLKTGQCPAHT